MDILQQAQELSDGGNHVFPSASKSTKHLNIISLDRLREKIGVKGKLDNHGVRAVLKTWAHEETDYRPYLVEQCLGACAVGIRESENSLSPRPWLIDRGEYWWIFNEIARPRAWMRADLQP